MNTPRLAQGQGSPEAARCQRPRPADYDSSSGSIMLSSGGSMSGGGRHPDDSRGAASAFGGPRKITENF